MKHLLTIKTVETAKEKTLGSNLLTKSNSRKYLLI